MSNQPRTSREVAVYLAEQVNKFIAAGLPESTAVRHVARANEVSSLAVRAALDISARMKVEA